MLFSVNLLYFEEEECEAKIYANHLIALYFINLYIPYGIPQ